MTTTDTPIQGQTARLDWSLYVDCPSCKETFDLADHDDEHTCSRAIFTNKWDSLKGHEVACPKCDHEFKLEKVEY